jgi:ubiquitin C-terminal hydrolase
LRKKSIFERIALQSFRDKLTKALLRSKAPTSSVLAPRLQISFRFIRRCFFTARYVGLMNKGATCHLNSLLQAFFHLPALRSIVCQILLGERKSIPFNVQRLFYNMQFAAGPCRRRH